jgi:signal transduction histidine kinase
VRPRDFARLTTFRWALSIAGVFALSIAILFGFVYWRTAAYMTGRMDAVIIEESAIIESVRGPEQLELVGARLLSDPRRIKVAGLFAPGGRRIAGNIETLPPHPAVDAAPAETVVTRIGPPGPERERVRAVARRLPDGEILVIGRNIDELTEIGSIVEHALALGVVPALILSLAAGVGLSLRAQRRIEAVTETARRIVGGHLRERLPTNGVAGDPLDQLASIVNGMLDEIEGLIQQLAGVGDDIAHEVRTPLTRVRAVLERGREHATSVEEFNAVVDRAIGGLDKSLAIVTALLRIAAIEHGRKRAGFGPVDLAGVVLEVAELYDPIAEDRGVMLEVEAAAGRTVRGDRDLLFEAIANLVDNAVKFTPDGGRVEIELFEREGEVRIGVSDSGPGISEAERDVVTRRFYRSDKARQAQGVGLGLSLVAAIVKLHGFSLHISSGSGCRIEIAAPQAG